MAGGGTTALFEMRLIQSDGMAPREVMVASWLRALDSGMQWARSVRWWTSISFMNRPRNEIVVQIISERHAPVTRLDNLYTAWLRVIRDGVVLDGQKLPAMPRAKWLLLGSWQTWADARVLPLSYPDAVTLCTATAKQTDAQAIVCSSSEPPLPNDGGGSSRILGGGGMVLGGALAAGSGSGMVLGGGSTNLGGIRLGSGSSTDFGSGGLGGGLGSGSLGGGAAAAIARALGFGGPAPVAVPLAPTPVALPLQFQEEHHKVRKRLRTEEERAESARH
jgi:hypothetical protein